MEDEWVTVYDYQDSSSENPGWIWAGTLEHIAALGLDPILSTKKVVPIAEIDETGRYRPERGTGQQ
jgi:hypothetical protein